MILTERAHTRHNLFIKYHDILWIKVYELLVSGAPYNVFFFFLKDAAPPEISPFPPHAALPIGAVRFPRALRPGGRPRPRVLRPGPRRRGQALAGRGDLAAPPAPPLILASTSPRRREILEQLRIPFLIVAPSYVEAGGHAVVQPLGKARTVRPSQLRPGLGG